MSTEVSNVFLMGLTLLLSAILGGIVGYEREVHEHPAGLRTHMLVCMGAALITLVSTSFGRTSEGGRIAAQIVSGIGFLGAGTILRQGNIVRGLTTAASLWTVAGIGMAAAVQGPFSTYSLLAIIATVIVYLTLTVARLLEPGMTKAPVHDVRLEIPVGGTQIVDELLQSLGAMGIVVEGVKTGRSSVQGVRVFKLTLIVPPYIHPEAVVRVFSDRSDLIGFEWE
jgi:putative Mg2+ transporter-C (MgtC) family protein